MSQNVISQIQKLNDILKGMKRSVSSGDRASAMKTFGYSIQTLSRYLNGKAMSIDTATSLIKFFKERIAERDKITAWEPQLESEKQIA